MLYTLLVQPITQPTQNSPILQCSGHSGHRCPDWKISTSHVDSSIMRVFTKVFPDEDS